MVFNLMATKVHRLLKVTEFNANGIWRRLYDFSKQLQDLHINVVLLSEINLKSHERFFMANYHFCRVDAFPGRKVIPHNHVDLCYVWDTYT
jgi:hypothetical protein